MVRKIAIGIAGTVTMAIVAGAIWLASGGFVALAQDFIVQPHYERRIIQFEISPVQAGDTVFLGDSLTEYGPWDGLFSGTHIKNRGILGDDTAGVLARLDQVTVGRPGQVFLMIGTNDLPYGVAEEEIVANVEEIISTINTESPDTELFVQSLLPRAQGYQEQVESLNQRLKSAVSEQATWIDLYPHFLDSDGSMADKYSKDELHLFGEGYLTWRDVILGHVNDTRPETS